MTTEDTFQDSRAKRMESLLRQSLEMKNLRIVNNSHLHRHHSGDDGSGQTHYAVHITSFRFVGLSRVEQHRLVMTILNDEFIGGLHALELDLQP